MRRILLSLLLLPLLTGCPIPDFVHPPGAPVIERFVAVPFSVSPGAEVTLSWRVAGADEVRIPAAFGSEALGAEGERTVTVEAPATFVLQATGPGGTARAVAEVETVEIEEVRIIRFEVTPTLVEPGDPVRVVWRTENATRVVIRLSTGETVLDRAPDAGTLVLRPEEDVTLTLFAEGSPEAKRALRTIRARPDGPRITAFYADPQVAATGDTVGLVWEVENADVARISRSETSTAALLFEATPPMTSGWFPVQPEPGPTTYLLEASSSAGAVVESTTVFVSPPTPPEIVSFVVTPTITGPGGDVFVEWATRFAESVRLTANQDSFFEQEGMGRVWLDRVAPADISVELVASQQSTGLEDRETRTVIVSSDLPRIDLFSANSVVVTGEEAVVSWSVFGADRVELRSDFGQLLETSTAAAGGFSYPVTEQVTLELAAFNARGTTRAYAPITTAPPVEVDTFTVNATVARVGRHVQFDWTTTGAESARLSYDISTSVPPDGNLRRPVPNLGITGASLEALNALFSTTEQLMVTPLPQTNNGDGEEDEPNDVEAVADGNYFDMGGAIDAELSPGADVDLFVLEPPSDTRLTLSTVPQSGCPPEGAAIELYEFTPELGLLGPRIVVDIPGSCAVLDESFTPLVPLVAPPYWIRVRRPTGTATTTAISYRLTYAHQVHFCGDGTIDRNEECDDLNLDNGDGCDDRCRVEGGDETDPNDDFDEASPIAVDDPIVAHLLYQDVDFFRFDVTAADAGQRSIVLESPAAGLCERDIELSLYDANRLLVASDDNGGLGCPALTGPAVILAPGTYFLRVAPGIGVTLPTVGRYLFEVR